MSTKFRE